MKILLHACCGPCSLEPVRLLQEAGHDLTIAYQENIDHIGFKPEEILMVGNNTNEDLSAMKLGCDGYLVTDYLLDPIGFDIDSVKHGSLSDFLAFAQALPECE